MVLVSDRRRFKSHETDLLGKYKNSKLKFVWKTALDNQRVFNLTRNPDWRVFLF